MARFEYARSALIVVLGLAAWTVGEVVATAILIALTDTPLAFNTAGDKVSLETFLVLIFRAALAFAVAAAIVLPIARSMLSTRARR